MNCIKSSYIDKANSHTTSKTFQYLQEVKQKTGITTIHNSNIPVKSLDCACLHFFLFWILKAKTLNDIWKACQEECNKIDINLTQKVFQS